MLVRLLTSSRSDDSVGVQGAFRARYISRESTISAYSGESSMCGFIRSPTFQGATMLLTDGSSSIKEMYPADACDFTIAPQANTTNTQDKITLIMSIVSMKDGSSMRVTDGQKILWNCVGCLKVVPPPMVSSTGIFTIAYTTTPTSATYVDDNGQLASYRGFEAKYFANFAEGRGMGDSQVHLRMASALSIAAPTYNQRYPTDVDLLYWIKPNSPSPGTQIIVSVHLIDFDLNDTMDNLTIYEGEWQHGDGSPIVLKTFTSRQQPMEWVTTDVATASAVTLRMQSNGWSNLGTGFNLGFFQRCGQLQMRPYRQPWRS